MSTLPPCPLPLERYPRITMAHGGGGRLTRRLVDELFRAAFANPYLDQEHDAAVCTALSGRIVVTTDAYVVRPLRFLGGDIGTLAVTGTVNDLAMAGARPLYLTAAFVLEEGLPTATLWEVACSMGETARRAGVALVAGDTKVVERGHGDGLYVTTAGVGELLVEPAPLPERVVPGDVVILSGDVGRHGVAVLAEREGLAFESPVASDCALLHEAVAELVAAVPVHCLRDLTRGGLATALDEIARMAGVGIAIEETAVLVDPGVEAACTFLGLDPYYVACEGRFVALVPAEAADAALAALRRHPVAADARVVGEVVAAPTPQITARSAYGTERVLDPMSGEQLPRIC